MEGDVKSEEDVKSEGDVTQIAGDDVCDAPFLPYKAEEEFNKPRQHRAFVEKVMYTAFLCSAFFVFGWTYEQMGPALLDLQYNTDVTFTLASVYMTAVNIAHIAGSLGASVMYGRLPTTLILGVSILGVSAAMAVIPWCEEFLPMLLGHSVQGLFGGSVDSVVLAEMLSLWGSDSESPMQALYFSFAFGAILSPLVVTPFLRNSRGEGATGGLESQGTTPLVTFNDTAGFLSTIKENALNVSPYGYASMSTNTTSVTNISSITSIQQAKNITAYVNLTCIQYTNVTFPDCYTEMLPSRYSSDLYIPYSISSGLCLLVSLPFLVFFSLTLMKKFKVSYIDDETRITKTLSNKLKIVTLLVTGVISGIDTAMEDAYGDFLTAFCVSQMGWTKQNGAIATSLFHGSFAFGRFVGIFLAMCFKPLQLVLAHSFLLIGVNGVFIVSGVYGFGEGVWVCSVLAGIGMSVISPSIFTLTEESFFPVTGRIASYYVITACLGSAINSVLIGYLMDTWSHMYMLYVLCAEGLLIFFMALVCKVMLSTCYKEVTKVPAIDNVDTEDAL
ncbi:sodium-dependent glucose transporter 1-like [Mizuhopecten yessoensis]|uniref:Major facilitator superfamily domain-containing protein 4-A n=1 Tax=Mizuhopecten yessoensis TaxID=6573 RepID=A0A210PXY7_MIZYE|nr:sodium-dependent glucose transporter 1-like [Mizuhopecten yessoensis]XP_021372337.1 sodium-dependent glucose transporter 1-like [Mizuhopecten yessoensis]OWF41345.1 Major facilitator superfamily domain-containing protein 4-A [Mizuhopecten yessoensis]